MPWRGSFGRILTMQLELRKYNRPLDAKPLCKIGPQVGALAQYMVLYTTKNSCILPANRTDGD